MKLLPLLSAAGEVVGARNTVSKEKTLASGVRLYSVVVYVLP
jgi:hypothetical protein